MKLVNTVNMNMFTVHENREHRDREHVHGSWSCVPYRVHVNVNMFTVGKIVSTELWFFPVFWGSRTTRRLQRLPSSSASHVVRARDIGRCTEQQCALGLPLALSSSGSASGRRFRQWRCVVRVLCEMNLVAILPCGTWRHNTTPARHPLGVDLHASRLGFPPSKSLRCPPP